MKKLLVLFVALCFVFAVGCSLITEQHLAEQKVEDEQMEQVNMNSDESDGNGANDVAICRVSCVDDEFFEITPKDKKIMVWIVLINEFVEKEKPPFDPDMTNDEVDELIRQQREDLKAYHEPRNQQLFKESGFDVTSSDYRVTVGVYAPIIQIVFENLETFKKYDACLAELKEIDRVKDISVVPVVDLKTPTPIPPVSDSKTLTPIPPASDFKIPPSIPTDLK